MGFGFNLLFVFIIVPLTALLFIIWAISKKSIFAKIIGIIWTAIIGIVILSLIISTLTQKKLLTKKDYYGHYIIDRDFFPGKQADWQYDNFRFEIKPDDKIYFYVTDKEKILKTYAGTISTVAPYNSERLVINMQQPAIHITKTNPTIYRSTWSFYMVFNSEKFNNMYFKKGDWTPIKK